MDDEVDHTAREGQAKRRMEKLKLDDWFGSGLFTTVEGDALLVRSSYGVEPFMPFLPWSNHCFYRSRSFHAPQTAYVDGFVQGMKPLTQNYLEKV